MQTTESQEIIRSLSELKSESAAAMRVLDTKVDGINRRLDVSNGRISENEKAIQELRIQESRILLRLGVFQTEQEDRARRFGRVKLAMLERLMWIASAIGVALVTHYLRL